MYKHVKGLFNLIMQNNATVLVTVCILLCLTLNYTFPLHREKKSSFSEYINSSWHWDDLINHKRIVERSKKMANDIENVIKRIKSSAADVGKNIYHDTGLKRENKLSEEDLRQYEQLVIMKKYPYLDVKDLELRLSPLSNKNSRQSLRIEPESNLHSDSNLCDPEDVMNVEIINRGLSGFSIPPKIAKGASMVENKLKFNNMKDNEDKSENGDPVKLSKKYSKRDSLDSLEKEIVEYAMKKNVKQD